MQLNPDVNAFQRKFVNEVRRCDEMSRKLRFFEAEIGKAGLHVNESATALNSAAPDSNEMQSMEAEFEQLEREMKEINGNEETLKKQELELKELREILRKTGVFFEEAEAATASLGSNGAQHEDNDGNYAPLLNAPEERAGQLGFVAGVIARDRVPGFERLLWRACRGNVFLRRVPVEEMLRDPHTDQEMLKEVFIIFYQGEQLENRTRKICEGFDATLYPCPASPGERRDLALGVDTRIQDLQMVLNRTAEHRRQVLGNVAFKINAWDVKVQKIKAIYHTMNKFNIDVTRKALIAECWCPVRSLPDIQAALREGTERSGTDVPAILNRIKTKQTPPTYHITNKFTDGFQNIVDAYGVSSYREVNPGPFTIITFPFLFAVMFGDLGHGILMSLIAFYLIYKEKALSTFKGGGEIWDTMFGGRYIIFLMGLFSIYTGFIYNDVFSKALSLGGSGWDIPAHKFPLNLNDSKDITIDLEPPNATDSRDFSHAYVFGVDPIWAETENKLTFTNSYKMKLSVILGVMQMEFGVILGFFNHRFFGDPLRILHEFIPQVLFLTCIFGYLVIMIIFKWSQPWTATNPPSLLLMLINMFLKFGTPPADGEVLYGSSNGSSQKNLQMFLVVTAVICVPWMLLVRPLILRKRAKDKIKHDEIHGTSHDEHDDAMIGGEEDAHGHGGAFNFGDVMVHQAIHTIEFALGCISNTASYLRLWALSLAHSQLSEVLWGMVLHAGFKSWYMLYVAFFAWAVLTIGVLLIMEGLSAFLHALRLHWVEFQNKFYAGVGIKFKPFAFKKILSGTEDD
jgi:V-type H+-transporting ATPase subunit a